MKPYRDRKCRLPKHEDLSSILITHTKGQAWQCVPLIPVLGGRDGRIPWTWRAAKLSKQWAQGLVESLPQRIMRKELRNFSSNIEQPLASPSTCTTPTHTYTYIHSSWGTRFEVYRLTCLPAQALSAFWLPTQWTSDFPIWPVASPPWWVDWPPLKLWAGQIPRFESLLLSIFVRTTRRVTDSVCHDREAIIGVTQQKFLPMAVETGDSSGRKNLSQACHL